MTFTDDLGRKVTLSLPIKRIISLSPAATENLFAVGAGKLLVGITSADTYPVEVKKLPKVGDFGTPSYERIRELRPDVIIAESGTIRRNDMDNLQNRLKIPVFAQKSSSFEDVVKHIEQFGKLTGQERNASRVIKEMRDKAAIVAKRVRGTKAVTVFVEVSRDPLYGAGTGSFVDDLLKRANGVNILKGNNPYPQVGKETLLLTDPDFYLVAVGDAEPLTPPELPPPFDHLRASKAHRVRALRASLLFRPTPRLADGLLALAKTLHP